MADQVTRSEFEAKWGPRPDRIAVSCAKDSHLCDFDECEGWHWAKREWWEDEVRIGMRPASDLKALEA